MFIVSDSAERMFEANVRSSRIELIPDGIRKNSRRINSLRGQMMERHQDSKGRGWYKDKLSVTTILNGAINKPGLNQWRMKNSFNACMKALKKGADKGALIHSILESGLRNSTPPESDITNSVLSGLDEFKWQYPFKVIDIEKYCASEKFGYAGRYDLLAEFNDGLYVVDWKSGFISRDEESGEFNGPDPWQLAAYAEALNEESGMVSIKGTIIVEIKSSFNSELMFNPTFFEDYGRHFECFVHAQEIYKELNYHDLKRENYKWL